MKPIVVCGVERCTNRQIPLCVLTIITQSSFTNVESLAIVSFTHVIYKAYRLLVIVYVLYYTVNKEDVQHPPQKMSIPLFALPLPPPLASPPSALAPVPFTHNALQLTSLVWPCSLSSVVPWIITTCKMDF